ncbi:hypothetical protein NHJ13734_001589 [Beauveria thailandica]
MPNPRPALQATPAAAILHGTDCRALQS